MNQIVIGRIAGMLSSAVSQDLRNFNTLLRLARQDAFHATQQQNLPRRVGKRSGSAAARFEKEHLKKVEAKQQHMLWREETEEVLFDEF